MDMLLVIFMLFITSAESTQLHQQWTAKPGTIDIHRVRQDCMAGELTDTAGEVNVKGYVNAEAVVPTELSACAPADETFTGNMLKLLGSQIFTCYTNQTCAHIQWNPRNLQYRCPSGAKREQLLQRIRLKFDITCQAPSAIHFTNIQPETVISRNQQLCADGDRKRATHVFLTSACPKAQDNLSTREALTRLTTRLNECLTGCDSVSVGRGDLGRASCSLAEKAYTAIGVYWSCAGSSLTTTNTASKSARGTKRTDVEGPTAGAVRGEKGSPDVNEDNKYLHALIAVSVALVVVIAILIAVVVYFLILRGRRQRKSRSDVREGPPGRQALYNKISRDCVTSVHSNVRYTPAAGEDGKLADAPADDYAVPTEGGYEEEAAYEVVDIAAIKRSQESRSRLNRNGSTKYSDGYLLPTTSRAE